MLRSTLIRASETLNNLLLETEMSEVVGGTFRPNTKRDNSKTLMAYAIYIRSSSQFDTGVKELMTLLELDLLNDPQFWNLLLENGQERGHPALHDVYRSIRFATDALPKFVKLLRREHDARPPDKKRQTKGSTPVLLTVILIEGTQISTPERLATMFSSIEGMYNTCSDILGGEFEALAVVNCDSGSDKSFDFLGAAKVVECVKDLILGLWDKVIFFREAQAGRRLELVTQSLPIVEKISALEESGTIGREKAEILRRGVTSAVEGFLKCGALIPEIDDRKSFEPRLLMHPEVKLLTAPSDDTDLNRPSDTPIPPPPHPESPSLSSVSRHRRRKEPDENPKAPTSGVYSNDPNLDAFLKKKAAEYRQEKSAEDDHGSTG
jgi:hypothetical protein